MASFQSFDCRQGLACTGVHSSWEACGEPSVSNWGWGKGQLGWRGVIRMKGAMGPPGGKRGLG